MTEVVWETCTPSESQYLNHQKCRIRGQIPHPESKASYTHTTPSRIIPRGTRHLPQIHPLFKHIPTHLQNPPKISPKAAFPRPKQPQTRQQQPSFPEKRNTIRSERKELPSIPSVPQKFDIFMRRTDHTCLQQVISIKNILLRARE